MVRDKIILIYFKIKAGLSDDDTKTFKVTSEKFLRLFGLSKDEKLVNYYSCR